MGKLLRRVETNLQSEETLAAWNPGGIEMRAPLDVEISAFAAKGRMSPREIGLRWRKQHTHKM